MILISQQEAATMAEVSRRTIRRWLADGRITRHPKGLVDADEVRYAQSRARPRLAEWTEVLRDAAPMS